jgi:hypothetical protein
VPRRIRGTGGIITTITATIIITITTGITITVGTVTAVTRREAVPRAVAEPGAVDGRVVGADDRFATAPALAAPQNIMPLLMHLEDAGRGR